VLCDAAACLRPRKSPTPSRSTIGCVSTAGARSAGFASALLSSAPRPAGAAASPSSWGWRTACAGPGLPRPSARASIGRSPVAAGAHDSKACRARARSVTRAPPAALTASAIPKSATIGRPSCSRMFSGFRLPCTTPRRGIVQRAGNRAGDPLQCPVDRSLHDLPSGRELVNKWSRKCAKSLV
jgi:hypothetical protein